MKITSKISFAIIFILLALVTFGFMKSFIFVKNVSKDEISTKKFVDITTELGYEIEESQEINNIEYMYKAKKDSVEITLYIEKEDTNEKSFEYKVNAYEHYKTENSKSSINDLGHMLKYTLTTEKNYIFVCQVGDTMMFSKAPIEYKEEIEKILTSLGC